jgi:TatD DNase family protein
MLIDSHCHIDFPEFSGQLDSVLALMQANGVERALCVSVSLETFPRIRELSESYANIYSSVGIHPDHEDAGEIGSEELVRLAGHPKVIAIGETGLDYYRLKGDLAWQRERFRTHIKAAIRCGKPLIVHTREAAKDTLAIMREENADEAGGVMHCFTENWETAEAAMEMGFYISFSGIVTFKSARELREVARRVPLDRMLIETDAPFLAPVPHRGKINQPAYVKHVAEEIARIKELDLTQVAIATSNNFMRLFRVI